MNRYDIAKGKVSDKKEPEKTITFGFGNESVGREKNFELFRPHPGTTHRIGILYTDVHRLFVGTNVHFHNCYFRCKTINSRKEICCEKLGNPRFRTACVIINYGIVQSNIDPSLFSGFHVLPWVFPRGIYQQLNEVHKLSPLDRNDFTVTCNVDHHHHFRKYHLNSLNRSIMQLSERKDEIINTAIPMIKNLKNYLGRDLSSFEMGQLLDEPDRYNRRNVGFINR